MKKELQGTLVLVSVSLGNFGDLTARARDLLEYCDVLIGEEFRTTSTLLKSLSISKQFLLCNEHTTPEEIRSLGQIVVDSGLTVLVSDAGTPGIEDPGRELVGEVLRRGGRVQSAPGPTAFGAALSISGFKTSPFTFCGFLSRDSSERKLELSRYLKPGHTVVFYETPYRYKAVLRDLNSVLIETGEDRVIFFCLDLTLDSEFQFRGKLGELLKVLDTLPKGNPVIVVSQRKGRSVSKIDSKTFSNKNSQKPKNRK
ncbi:16S rRNA (cytidine(1402)-2'-O)-methyltransferase [Leptospira borgpetersenii]|uniref:Ribosomal RNA small subunit methyltransferase I n=4 Tax=Leptospira borgpetersenii TaxID=174 RepID=M3FHJ6_LEPBO|nr:SAM-dependent methyltransferase [Leptospira borgpetersenii]EMG01303.1 S-adenosylmethionine-dependent methyltransferase, YraL family [Leptospira borgpetersenii str. 200701203]AXX15452.1 16S rRNA methyltransferase [Leptospira borgpetersenii serovar Ceylonica]EKP13512.1 S-adenosylmethionine-dependent methyltransferase, YraL family [Leptospira borgpetersenii str. 200801926]EKQ91363.1 S-adenosylmethionine-dependent methyltransferase, YraL family [Leptospira borgpetersenii str. UI 09149]EMN13808.